MVDHITSLNCGRMNYLSIRYEFSGRHLAAKLSSSKVLPLFIHFYGENGLRAWFSKSKIVISRRKKELPQGTISATFFFSLWATLYIRLLSKDFKNVWFLQNTSCCNICISESCKLSKHLMSWFQFLLKLLWEKELNNLVKWDSILS